MRKPRYCLLDALQANIQHQKMEEPYDYGGERSVHRLRDCMLGSGFPNFKPDYNTIVIHPRATLTDLVSSVPIPKVGHLVSERFLRLLQQFKLPPHRVYSVTMTHKGHSIEGYSFILFPQPHSLKDAKTTADVEDGADADRLLCGVALLKLYRPSWMSQTWINADLKQAIEAAGITGVKIR
jgi:hypothetical protein